MSGMVTCTFLSGDVAGMPLLKAYEYALSITLQLWHLTTPRLLNNILLDVFVQLSSGNLIILITVCIPFHALHQKVGEHAVLGFLERFGSLVSTCRSEDGEAIGYVLLLGTDCDGAGGDKHICAACCARVAGVEEYSHRTGVG